MADRAGFASGEKGGALSSAGDDLGVEGAPGAGLLVRADPAEGEPGRAPFPDVAVHVGQTPRVRLLRRHRMGLVGAVLLVS